MNKMVKIISRIKNPLIEGKYTLKALNIVCDSCFCVSHFSKVTSQSAIAF